VYCTTFSVHVQVGLWKSGETVDSSVDNLLLAEESGGN
jgi:hypothetical protein